MAPASSKKRRRNVIQDEDEDENSSTPATSRPPPRRISRRSTMSGAADGDDSASDYDDSEAPQRAPVPAEPQADSVSGSDDDDDFGSGGLNDANGRAPLVKGLVRLALSSEYSRTPLRRADIASKVLGKRMGDFRAVFEEAQSVLRDTFGMELVQLPLREKVTLKERRAATQTAATTGAHAGAASASGSSAPAASGTKAWILRSLLPGKFATPQILPPSRCPTVQAEGAYVGLYSFVVAVITLNGGVLADAKLERYLRRVNADTSTPVDKTDRLLQRMVRDGYIVRVKESVGGEETVEYMVGSRAKMEIGDGGVEGLVKKVYGVEEAEGDGDGAAELQKRIERSLRVGMARTQATGTQQAGNGAGQTSRPRGRPRKAAQEDADGD